VSAPTPNTERKGPETGRMAEARAWRSFFGSLLKVDYPEAADAILEFVGSHYGLDALVWLDRRGDRFETTAGYGELKGRKVRLNISARDQRLIEALQNDVPLELGERRRSDEPVGRHLSLFPIAVDTEITAAIAVLGIVEPEVKKHSIVRLGHSLAPQLEILRLRDEVEHRERLADAVRNFSRSMRRVDRDDLWLSLTQSAAQMLDAERASLLVHDEREDKLELKALIGARQRPGENEVVGSRVSQIVFYKGEPAVIGDITRTGLPPISDQRGYKTLSFLSCPVTLAGRPVGVMNFTDRVGGARFDAESLDLFQAVAPQLAVAIDRALLKDRAG